MTDTVLIVDDSKLEREILKSVLRDSFQILEASDGEECIQVVKEHGHEINIVLLDLIMPNLDGIGVLKFRQKDPVFREIPAIVLTASESKEDQLTAFQLGANDYIRKPFEQELYRSG